MRYLVGIDLGTTNCALAYIDVDKKHPVVQQFSIPQLTGVGRIENLSILPSFCYLSASDEWPKGSLRLPWGEESQIIVGYFAKIQGSKVPTRLVQSAKSWLCNSAANRRDKILPLEAAELNQRMSPVEAAERYLVHLRNSWNRSIAKNDPLGVLEEQEIVLTVPASFDEVARKLTIEASQRAGFRHVTLLEEPQAALYSWLFKHQEDWSRLFKKGEKILVCDVGGGTTDFSLIEIDEKDGKLSFQRKAVGDHLLLGGDNMDMALARLFEQKLLNQGHSSLESDQWLRLLAEARRAKEALLGKELASGDQYTLVIQGSGSSVIGGSLSLAIEPKEIESFLLEGFFGFYPFAEASVPRRSRGMRTMGLPYEDDPSISRHLARFLKESGSESGVDYILFNGGAMKPAVYREAICQHLRVWFPEKTIKELPSVDFDLAVARGAAAYANVKRGVGVSIGGGIPRTYYLEVEVKSGTGSQIKKALTLIPRGSEEGYTYVSNESFALRTNTPVSFHLLTSHVRLDDQAGTLHAIEETEMQRLPSIQTILRFGKKQLGEDAQVTIPVNVGIKLTPIGTVEIWLESKETTHRWELEFQIRSGVALENQGGGNQEPKPEETYASGYLDEAKQVLDRLFDAETAIKPRQIFERLEQALALPRKEWSLSIMRGLFDCLLKNREKRKNSLELEARWWNLAGFLMRPGYGYPLDDFRIKEMWKVILGELKQRKPDDIFIQMAICFRRIAGGLSKGQQIQLASLLMPSQLESKKNKDESRKGSENYLNSEKIRALAAMERLDLPLKIRIGQFLVERVAKGNATPGDYWSLGRIGARHLFYGSAAHVIPKEICSQWMETLLKSTKKGDQWLLFLFSQLARKVDQRELNLSEALINQVLERYPDPELEKRLTKEMGWTEIEREELFGDQLPTGLIIGTLET